MVKCVFGPGNEFWDSNDMRYNIMFVSAQKNYAITKFNIEGRLSLDDVLHWLGIPVKPDMPFTGWMASRGDDFVDFGIDYDLDHIDPNVGIEITFNCPGV